MNENIGVPQDEFSLKSFFGLIKRSGKRLLVFGIIAAILGLCVGAVIVVCTAGNEEYRGSVEYTNSGVSEGLDPNDNVIDYSEIKSMSIINAALANLGYSEEAITRLADRLEDALVVEPYISEAIAAQLQEDPTMTYHPSRYNIVIKPSSEIGMSKSEYIAFINELMNSYMKYYKDKYKYSVELSSSIDSGSVGRVSDYYELIVLYQDQLDVMRSSVNSLSGNYDSIRARLLSKITLLESYVSQLENYILLSDVSKEGALVSLNEYLNGMIRDFNSIAQRSQEESEALTPLVEGYRTMFDNVLVEGDSIKIYGADLTAYNSLIAQKQAALSRASEYSAKAALLTEKKNMIGQGAAGDITEERKYVEGQFSALYTNLTSAMSEINAEMAAYGDKTVVNSGVKVTANAYRLKEVSYLGAIVAFVIILLAGLVAAVAVTAIKEKKRANAEKDSVEENKSAESVATEQKE